jgi:hypothetical protein
MKRATFKLRRSTNRKQGSLGWKAASPDALNRLITIAAIAKVSSAGGPRMKKTFAAFVVTTMMSTVRYTCYHDLRANRWCLTGAADAVAVRS